MMLPGVSLVISPLISLMKHQVEALKQSGIPAAYINSAMSQEEYQTVIREALKGCYKLIYVAPERLLTDSFLSFALHADISFISVDEVHCVSQWGQDFRPSYLRIVNFIDNLPYRPVVGAYTATATAQVRKDVEKILKLDHPVRTVTGFDRPNLFFTVMRPKDKRSALLKLVK